MVEARDRQSTGLAQGRHVHMPTKRSALMPCPVLPAQEKYRQKKSKKYVVNLTVRKPTARAICDVS